MLTHMHTHKHIHTHTHTQTHTYNQKLQQLRCIRGEQARRLAFCRNNYHQRACPFNPKVGLYVHTRTRTQTTTHTHAHAHTQAHTTTHTRTRTHTHTHTHTHVHTPQHTASYWPQYLWPRRGGQARRLARCRRNCHQRFCLGGGTLQTCGVCCVCGIAEAAGHISLHVCVCVCVCLCAYLFVCV